VHDPLREYETDFEGLLDIVTPSDDVSDFDTASVNENDSETVAESDDPPLSVEVFLDLVRSNETDQETDRVAADVAEGDVVFDDAGLVVDGEDVTVGGIENERDKVAECVTVCECVAVQESEIDGVPEWCLVLDCPRVRVALRSTVRDLPV
jgi:hypothetical protein